MRKHNHIFLYGETYKEFFRYNEIFATLCYFTIFIVIFKWWGILLGFVFHFFVRYSGGLLIGYYPPEKDYHRECSAGIVNCKICNNEYEHIFNENYKSEKWYKNLPIFK